MEAPRTIYKNKDLIAVDKPAGLLVHAVRVGNRNGKQRTQTEEPTLTAWLLKEYPEIKAVGGDPTLRPGIVHRLDRDTSGVMLVARTQAAFEYLKNLFQSREIKKTYLALVHGSVREKIGRVDSPISLKTHTTKRTVHRGLMEKEAITEYKVLKYVERSNGEGDKSTAYSLLEVRPLTGRTHQIRVHLASIGHPVVGDTLYGRRGLPRAAPGRLMLHALALEFMASDGTQLRLEAELPTAFKEIVGDM